jgi:putative ABC transport system permease protein
MMRRLFLKVFRRRTLDRDLEAELAFHREMSAASGNSVPLGNITLLKEQALDLWRFNFVENLWRDLVYAVRALRKSPGLVFAALLSLGLGIGVDTALFSLTMEFLVSDPSVRDPGSIVYLRRGENSHVSPTVVDEIRRSGFFDDVAGQNEEAYINFNNGVETHPIFAVQATRNYFTALGIPVWRGRGWNESDTGQVVVLHPHFWRTRLAADPGIVGKSIRLDGRPYTVLGILPDNYRSLVGYGFAPDVFVPTYIEGTVLAMYARLKPGMTLGRLQAALPALAAQLNQRVPARDDAEKHLNATPAGGLARLQREKKARAVSLFFVMLLAIVDLVLLIACVNVAGLLLARASSRRREIAIRLAIGASRSRLLQQLLAESLLLSIAGAGLGFALALAVARAAAAIPLPIPVPVRLHIEPDWRVVCYAAGLTIASAMASGLVPAWQSLRDSLSAGMQRERKLRLRRLLVAAQVAISFVVLTAAALFLRNLMRTNSLGPGFDIRNTVRAEVYLPPAAFKESTAINVYVARSLEELHAIPGVEAAAAARIIPFTGATNMGTNLRISGSDVMQFPQFNWNAVTPEYFRAMDIPILQGRTFAKNADSGFKVVVVNGEFVRRYVGGRDPLTVTFTWANHTDPYRIVGVARSTKNMTIGEDPRAQMYEPLWQIENDRSRLQFVTRSAIPPAALAPAVRQVLRRVEPSAGLEVETMYSATGFAFLPSQVGAALMGGLGILGLLLAVVGLYGVLAYSVVSRTREIGVRVAIGASPGQVSALVFREVARLLAVGISTGLLLAIAITRPLAMFFVPGLSATDPASFAAVIAVLVVTGTLAALGPVRRATHVDPLQSLRAE